LPSTPFKVDIEFCTASLQLVDHFPVATFALKQALVSVDRAVSNGIVTNRVGFLVIVAFFWFGERKLTDFVFL